MTNCMHQNIIKYIPYSFKTLRSRSVLQRVKLKRTMELFIVYNIIVWLVWLTCLDYDIMLRLCYELFDSVIEFERDNWYLHDLRAMFGQIRLLLISFYFLKIIISVKWYTLCAHGKRLLFSFMRDEPLLFGLLVLSTIWHNFDIYRRILIWGLIQRI